MSHSASRYLLDTNILSDLLKQPQGRVAEAIMQVRESRVCTSIIVASELRFGAVKSGSLRLQKQADAILAVMDILPVEPPVDKYYADLRWQLEQAGTPIGPNDMLIAAQALASDCVVVTANLSAFQRVPSLQVVNWLAI